MVKAAWSFFMAVVASEFQDIELGLPFRIIVNDAHTHTHTHKSSMLTFKYEQNRICCFYFLLLFKNVFMLNL